MTREQQRKLKELKQNLPQILKSNVKSYGLKKKDYMVWYQKDDVYFSLLIDIREKDGHCYCVSEERIKPLWLDDLFWDIMDMPENKSEPLSLRCIGAFAIYGMTSFECEQDLPEWSAEELKKCVITYIEHFHQYCNNSNIENYYSIFDSSAYQGDIQEILILLHRQEYQKALKYIQSMENGGQFENKGICFKNYAEKYCKKHIRHGRRWKIFK